MASGSDSGKGGGAGGDGGGGYDGTRSAAGARSPWLMIAVISLGTFIETLDTSIANVSLANIAGSLGVSTDQSTWIVTSYLVANACIIPISGFLSRVIGRKRYFMISIALFSGSSLLCALAPNIGFLILARVLQGIGGGGLAPVEQSMITDSFPPEKRGQAFGVFGVVIVVAPIIGPTLGGYITDTISWHWIFFINVPIGAIALVLVRFLVDEPDALVRERAALLKGGVKVDYVGFVLTVAGLAGLLVTLDRGQSEGWFDSHLIVTTTAMAIVGLGAMVAWELNHDDPIVPLKLLRIPNFAISVAMMMVLGLLVFGTIQIIPQMLQQIYGYTAYRAGLALTYGGAVAILMMPVAGALTGKVDTRMLLVPAFGLQALGFWWFTGFSVDSTFADAAWGRFLMSVALPMLFIPINTVAYVGLAQSDSDKASAMLNFFRNLGGAFGISLAQTLLVRREQFHQDRIVEGLNPLNPAFEGAVNRLAEQAGGREAALGTIYGQVREQAGMLSYVDVFHVLMWCTVALLPLLLFLKPAGAPAGAAGRRRAKGGGRLPPARGAGRADAATGRAA